MRYLIAIAQDRFENGRTDSVLLEFHEVCDQPPGTVVVSEAVAIDFDADGKVDFQKGDVNHNGKENSIDHRLLAIFANSYMKMNWTNTGVRRNRYMKIFSEDFHGDGSPNVVKLQLYTCRPDGTEEKLVSWHGMFDSNNDGTLDCIVNADANHDGLIEHIDSVIVQSLANVFQMFKWKG
ncbi:hypothetical protein [Pseudomonas fluorescens]|uniref:hypothetical protein n=1 Tax=Pseudomonas fluorescens TaxID=294 RepID=UPI00259B286B|nr:hypothetical protein [Pseudomonas fluorescens]WJK09599.1 hypothetical protein QR290_27915 [Pseudomonas fluorescens]